MAIIWSGRPVFITTLVLLHLAWTNGQTSLQILPSGDKHSRPSGMQYIITCKLLNSGNPNLVSIEWLGPNMSKIESRHSSSHTNPNLYTEKPQDSGLSLVFNPLKEELSGTYTCTGTFAGAETLNKSVEIESIEMITFKDAPEMQYATLGKEYKIRCEVRAQPAPTVRWFKDDELIKTDDHYIIETHALKINKVQEDDKGVYNCRAAVLQTGELQERFITLEVQEEPKINEERTEIEIIEGKAQKIDICKASGRPAPKYSWIQTMIRLNLSDADRFIVDRDTGLLQITEVKREDEGEYQCFAENAAGRASLIVRIKVIEKPKIMDFLNKTIAVGKNVDLTCTAYGKPAPDVTFRKQTGSKAFVTGNQPNDDRIILRSIPDHVSGKTVATLTISNVARQDDGLYECIAKNKVEEARKNGHLTVEFPPSFASMVNQSVWSWDRRPVNLTCIAESIPNATIKWYHGDRPLFEHQYNRNEPSSRNEQIIYKIHGNGPISTLQVTPHDRRDYGFYKCKANNVHGEASHRIELKEGRKPDAIPQVIIAEITATTIRFDIMQPPMEPELPIKTITVQYKPSDIPSWNNARNKSWSLGSPYVLERLTPQTSYNFRFHATNDVGSGNWGGLTNQVMPMRSVPQAPKIQMQKDNAKFDISHFSNQYRLKWIAPLDNGEPIDKYDVKICELQENGGDYQVQERSCRHEEVKGQRVEFYIKDLVPERYYYVELRAHNLMGHSEAGVVRIKTDKATNSPVLHQGPLISSAAIIGIVIAILFLIIVIIDIICCCAHKTGIIFYLCERSKRKPVDEEDAKLGSLYGWRFPLPYCDQKMANVAGVTAIQDSSSGKNTIKLVKHTAIEEKEPLKEEKKITPIIDSGLRRETSITFDGKRSISKTGFVGKDSAV